MSKYEKNLFEKNSAQKNALQKFQSMSTDETNDQMSETQFFCIFQCFSKIQESK